MKGYCLLVLAALILVIQFLFSCSGNLSVETMQYATNGQKLYKTHCQNCHGAKGEGLGRLYPPLTDANFLNEHRRDLACIVKYGMSGEIEVSGVTYNENMPGVPELTPIDIAYVLTYITTYFGDSQTHFTQQEIEKQLTNCQ